MEAYLKKFFVGHLLILVIIAFAIRFWGGSELMATLLFAGLLESLFYYLDTRYIPKRRAELTNELIEIFKAEPFSEGALKFRIRAIEFFVKIKIDFKQVLQGASVETIQFDVPRTQINKLSASHKLNSLEDTITGIQTYVIYQTNGSGLKQAKKVIEKMTEGATADIG